nr:PREDICTED: aquaporin-10 isoform X2 [Latimeria chalumnae]|eukprot:XP_014349232.1 PREDICTED: aquaporin-10 isoform X2 [Latimeria chalumnae]
MKGRKVVAKVKTFLRIKNKTLREALAEVLGTFIMMLFGLGSVAQVIIGGGKNGEYLSINLSFAMGVTMGIHMAGGVSDALHEYCGGNLTVTGPKATAEIFSTYPAPYLTLSNGFLDQVVGTAVLLIGILAINDQKNNPALNGTQGLSVGLLVLVIGMSMGMNCGYAINPARDLPPRIFTAIAGWGLEVFRAGNNWWWVPIVAPLVGSVIGACIYQIFIEGHHKPEPEGNSSIEFESGKMENTINI